VLGSKAVIGGDDRSRRLIPGASPALGDWRASKRRPAGVRHRDDNLLSWIWQSSSCRPKARSIASVLTIYHAQDISPQGEGI